MNLPFFLQETPYSCVPACLRMVLAASGVDISESELRVLCDCTPFGTDALLAIDAAKKLGFERSAKLNLEVAELLAFLQSGIAPIAFINLKPIDGIETKHAVVVTEITTDSVTLLDPLIGERVLALSVFQISWLLVRNLALVIH